MSINISLSSSKSRLFLKHHPPEQLCMFGVHISITHTTDRLECKCRDLSHLHAKREASEKRVSSVRARAPSRTKFKAKWRVSNRRGLMLRSGSRAVGVRAAIDPARCSQLRFCYHCSQITFFLLLSRPAAHAAISRRSDCLSLMNINAESRPMLGDSHALISLAAARAESSEREQRRRKKHEHDCI